MRVEIVAIDADRVTFRCAAGHGTATWASPHPPRVGAADVELATDDVLDTPIAAAPRPGLRPAGTKVEVTARLHDLVADTALFALADGWLQVAVSSPGWAPGAWYTFEVALTVYDTAT